MTEHGGIPNKHGMSILKCSSKEAAEQIAKKNILKETTDIIIQWDRVIVLFFNKEGMHKLIGWSSHICWNRELDETFTKIVEWTTITPNNNVYGKIVKESVKHCSADLKKDLEK